MKGAANQINNGKILLSYVTKHSQTIVTIVISLLASQFHSVSFFARFAMFPTTTHLEKNLVPS